MLANINLDFFPEEKLDSAVAKASTSLISKSGKKLKTFESHNIPSTKLKCDDLV